MLPHEHEKKNLDNDLIFKRRLQIHEDGLSNVKYKIILQKNYEQYRHIIVDV